MRRCADIAGEFDEGVRQTMLITGGRVADGSGSALVCRDIRIRGARIVEIGEELAAEGDEVLDVTGLVVAPGFIDMHSHADVQIRVTPHGARLQQGITTEVLGQDGLGVAPIADATRAHLRAQIAGWIGSPEVGWNWNDVDEYLDWLDESIPVNAAFLVPHANLRLLVMGNAQRDATPAEIDEMCRLLELALAQGAFGMSAGLTYVPGSYATTDELVALCRVVARAGGYFCPHHRNYGAQVLEGYAECLDIARRSGVRLHLAHAHLSFPQNEGRIDELLALLDEAERDGVALTFDSYPYLAGMTSLHALLPSWALGGTLDEQRAALADPATRSRIRHELDVVGTDGNQGLPVDWSTVRLASAPQADWCGTSLRALGESEGVEPSELCLRIVEASDFGATCTLHFGIEEHVRRLMADRRHTVGTDGILVGQTPHPRGWGAFACMLGHYVREQAVLGLPEAIRHMTSAPAGVLGLRDRGRIAIDALADLVVFDPDRVADLATYADPRQSPQGIVHVFVNGEAAVRDGALTGARAGRALRAAPAADDHDVVDAPHRRSSR